MNDEDVLTRYRDGFRPLRMSTTADDIIGRGRVLRRRERGGRLAAGGAALTIALGAALGVPALTTSPSSAPAHATLTAWTVSRPDAGSITVSVRELRDLGALQSRLAADGARVTIGDTRLTLPPGCVLPPTSGLLSYHSGRLGQDIVFTIHSARIPGGQVLRILLTPNASRSTPPVTEHDGTAIASGAVTGTTTPGFFFTTVRNSTACTS